MPGALTPSQIRVLHRARDGKLWSGECSLDNELGEAMFLAGLGLLEYVELGVFELTELGRRYLAEVERSTPDEGLPGPPPPG